MPEHRLQRCRDAYACGDGHLWPVTHFGVDAFCVRCGLRAPHGGSDWEPDASVACGWSPKLTRQYSDDFSDAAFSIGDTVRVPLRPSSAAYRITQAQQAHDKDHGT